MTLTELTMKIILQELDDDLLLDDEDEDEGKRSW